jgi:hypothetical protein
MKSVTPDTMPLDLGAKISIILSVIANNSKEYNESHRLMQIR